MRRSIAILIGATTGMLLAACGNGSTTPGSTTDVPGDQPLSLDDAARAMRDLVDLTAATALPNFVSVVEDEVDRQGCGAETDEEFIDYELSIDVPADGMNDVVAAVWEYWEPLGALDEDPGTGISIELAGYGVGLTAFPAENRIVLGGATRCLPPDLDDSSDQSRPESPPLDSTSPAP